MIGEERYQLEQRLKKINADILKHIPTHRQAKVMHHVECAINNVNNALYWLEKYYEEIKGSGNAERLVDWLEELDEENSLDQ